MLTILAVLIPRNEQRLPWILPARSLLPMPFAGNETHTKSRTKKSKMLANILHSHTGSDRFDFIFEKTLIDKLGRWVHDEFERVDDVIPVRVNQPK